MDHPQQHPSIMPSPLLSAMVTTFCEPPLQLSITTDYRQSLWRNVPIFKGAAMSYNGNAAGYRRCSCIRGSYKYPCATPGCTLRVMLVVKRGGGNGYWNDPGCVKSGNSIMVADSSRSSSSLRIQ